MTGGKLFQILRPAIVGGAADFKVGYKRGFASGASEKKFVPPLFTNMGVQASKYVTGVEIQSLVQY